MNAKRRDIGSDLHKVDAHTVGPEEYEELPELTDAMFKRATYKVGGVPHPMPKRGRPTKDVTKVSTTVRLDRQVIDAFRATGRGWQTRINEALKEWLAAHR